MTTIAASRHGMAGDTLAIGGDIKSSIKKIHRTPKGIVGYAGDVNNAHEFIAWFKDRRRKPPADMTDTDILVLTPKGELFEYSESLTPIPITDEFCAIGSGAMAALASLKHDPDLTVAIEIAMQIDASTGGDIDYEER